MDEEALGKQKEERGALAYSRSALCKMDHSRSWGVDRPKLLQLNATKDVHEAWDLQLVTNL